ncbi:hypothetical protein TNCV_2435161 [Trichonephila clavipes]|nr:hypothetical protein TNCV_2435161 [Trichonephila clavipes]
MEAARMSKDKNWEIFNLNSPWAPVAPIKDVAHFRLLTGDYCLETIGIAYSTDCTLCDFGKPMRAEYFDVCPTLISLNPITEIFWIARALIA